MDNSQNLNLSKIFGLKNIILLSILCISLFIVLSSIFISIDAFETLHTFSRAHEDWELDELILVAVSMIVAISISTLVATIVLGRRLIKNTQERFKVEQQLYQSRKLQSMGNLLGGISHSINNYLLPIITLSRMVKNDLPKDSEEAQDLERVINAANSAKDMLRKVLNFTRQKNMNHKDKCIIGITVKVAVELASTACPSSIQLNTDISDIKETAPISQVNLEIIILNLITNAIDAIENSNGNIYISLYKLESLNSPLNCSSICIKIKDNGQGLNEEQKMRIFDPFYTTKKPGKGTGLGLSETYGIISVAKGIIEVDSTEGEFTEFSIYLPIIS